MKKQHLPLFTLLLLLFLLLLVLLICLSFPPTCSFLFFFPLLCPLCLCIPIIRPRESPIFHSTISTRLRCLCHVSVSSPSISHHHLASVGPQQARGHQCRNSGQARPGAGLWIGGKGFLGREVFWMGLVAFSSGEGMRQKQSSLPVGVFVLGCSSSPPLVWTWILAIVSHLVALWCVYRTWAYVYMCVCIFVLVSRRFDCSILLYIHLFLCTNPALPTFFGFQPLLVCFWFEKHALVVFFCHFVPKSISKVVVMAGPPEKKTNVWSYLSNMSISGLHSWISINRFTFCFVIFSLS